MAKARRIPGLSAREPYAAAAAKIVEIRVNELMELAEGVLDVGDIERVHDMRVATRRLRAALEIFAPCFPRSELRAALRQVKALADALGERRDRDVAIASLNGISESLSASDRPGIEALVERLRMEQAAANEALARIVSPDQLAPVFEQLSELAGSAFAAEVKGSPSNGPVEVHAGERT
jgi:CHAD domain-containing protein